MQECREGCRANAKRVIAGVRVAAQNASGNTICPLRKIVQPPRKVKGDLPARLAPEGLLADVQSVRPMGERVFDGHRIGIDSDGPPAEPLEKGGGEADVFSKAAVQEQRGAAPGGGGQAPTPPG